MEKKYTGFKTATDKPIYVDDVLAHYNGYQGYYRVIERDNTFILMDISGEFMVIPNDDEETSVIEEDNTFVLTDFSEEIIAILNDYAETNEYLLYSDLDYHWTLVEYK